MTRQDDNARIIDGKALAAGLRARVAKAVAELQAVHDLTPGIAVVLVGDDPASAIYVRSKSRQVAKAGMASFDHRLPADTTQDAVLKLVHRLNADPAVHGILVQLPLPAHIDARAVIESLDPAKDVDGFHPVNAGALAMGAPALVPCTPLGCMLLAETAAGDLTGLDAVVLGRSNIVGKPLAQLLLAANCTVTIAHSRSRDLARLAARADLLVAAVGRPRMVRADWIKRDAIVIDVGINRMEGADGKTHLVGDVDFEQAVRVAGAITPVPGGVGPMTIACLLRNTVQAACAIRGVPMPRL